MRGQIGFSTIGGFTGWWVNLGQAFIKDSSRFTHVFILVGDGLVVEARPGGAGYAPLSRYPEAYISKLDLTEQQKDDIVRHAVSLVGTPYSFLDYLSLAALHFGYRPKWLRDYIQDTGHLICSQLVDLCYLKAGIHLFDDGRMPFDVSPGDLFYRVID